MYEQEATKKAQARMLFWLLAIGATEGAAPAYSACGK